MSTAVVSDTTSYLPEEVAKANEIHAVSLYVTLQENEQREADIADYDDFYERLAASGETVTTSQPSIGDFIEVYEPLLDDGREIVSIHIAAGISGTSEAAGQAAERLKDEGKGGERIHVLDSRSSAGGLGIIALAGAAAARGGADAAATLAAAQATRDATKIWFAVDTLEYLRRGGRIGAANAWIGTALKIKPILTLDGEITPIERVRTSSRAYARLLDYARKRKEDGATAWVVQHVHDPEAAAKLADDCREIFGSEPVFVSEVGPVIGAHIGPGMLGFGATTLFA